MEHLIDIPGRLHSVAVEKHVAGTDQIYDDILKTTQDILNLENITDVKVQEGKLQFLNIQGQVLKEISITTEQKQSDWNQTDSTQVDFIKNKPIIYNKQEIDNKLITKQDIIDDIATIRSNAQAGATAYHKPQTGIPATDLASDVQSDLVNIVDIAQVIPEQASESNQLADKNFVNSSVATNTANYISDNGQPFQSLEHLEAYEGILTNNDYAFIVGADSAGNTTYSRYKYKASTHQWALEYILNNSSFTAEQWESISSGITSGLVAKLSAMPTNSELTTLLNGKASTSELAPVATSGNYDDLTGRPAVDNTPTPNSNNLVTSGGVYDALQGEYVVATATADTGSVATAMVGIYDVNDVLIVEGEGEVTARILYGKTYKVKCSRIYDHLTPAEQTFVASIPSRQVMMQYTYIKRDVVTLDQTISDPAQMLSGDIQGDVIKEIRSHSHLYLGTPATQPGDTEGTELLCQLSDEDTSLYYDGTPAALDGSEGDQWLKLPVFWWKVVGVGEAAADGAHDQYRLMFAFAGEPDPSWNKWQGDRNLVGAKEMKVVNAKGRSVSGGQSTSKFTQAQGNAYAAARNLGCQLVTWEWHWIMCVLFYAWYGNTNSQAVCGIGSDNYNRTLGVTDKLGMTDTTPEQATSLTSARFWGLEAWWNDKMEWIGNVVMEDYVLRITDQNTKQTRQVSGFIQCGGSGGYISRIRIDANGDLVVLSKAGTETTFYCDWVNSNSGSRVVYRGSYSAYAHGGVSFASASNDASFSNAYIGSRLAFNGAITEAESVAAYKQALDTAS